MTWSREEGGDPSSTPHPGAKTQSPLVSVAGFVRERPFHNHHPYSVGMLRSMCRMVVGIHQT